MIHRKTSWLPRIAFVATLIMATWLFSSDCQACPNCKEALAGESNNVQLGYVYSIVFMISVPIIIFLGWSLAIYRMTKASKKQTQASVASANQKLSV